MKYIIIFLFLTAGSLIVSGFVLDVPYAQKLIGFGVAVLFLLAFPLFTYYSWKDKDVKDYMLTKENLDKMREDQKNRKL